MQTADRQDALRDRCPDCGSKGKSVKPLTIESLVVKEVCARAGRADGFRFCGEPTCDVAYFHAETGVRIAKSDVRVRIGQKETTAPRPICYCFDHTVEAIEAEVRATGTSKVGDEITEKCRQGLDRCEETNPQGSCCLANVRRAIKDAEMRQARGTMADVDGRSEVETEKCCMVGGEPATTTAHARNTGLWATGGAVGSAILSSACCWLPLLMIAFGASAAGVAGFFEAYRPYFLGITALLLSGGFYLVYVRREQCGPGERCAVPNPRLRRFNKIVLWIATTVVLAFALFPTYVGYLLGGGNPSAAAVAPGSEEGTLGFRIEGMTCEACAATLREHLKRVSGVARAEVSFPEKTARVFFLAAEDGPSERSVLTAIRHAGYSGTRVASSRTVRLAVNGMTCAGCATGLQARLASLPGVEAASVDYDAAIATVRLGPEGSLANVLTAIAKQGFEGREMPDNGLRR